MKGWKVEVSKGQYRKGKRNKEKDIKDLDDIDVIFEMVVIIMLMLPSMFGVVCCVEPGARAPGDTTATSVSQVPKDRSPDPSLFVRRRERELLLTLFWR